MKDLVANSDISVVIQGPLYLEGDSKGVSVIECIKSVKNALPGSKIIVSTWEDERVHFDIVASLADVVLFNPMPPAIQSYGCCNNITRQLDSTNSGLAQVNTPYVLKIRANIIIDKKTDFFSDPKSKINILALVGDPINSFMLFVMPDFIQFGSVELIRLLWGFEISPEKFYLVPNPPSLFDIYSFPHNFRFSPEQYLGLAWAERKHKARPLINHQFDINYSDFLYWKEILANDFNFFGVDIAGFKFSQQRYVKGKFIDPHGRWLKSWSRFQFAKLMINKYVLFFVNVRWWRGFFKYLLFKISESTYWTIYNSRK